MPNSWPDNRAAQPRLAEPADASESLSSVWDRAAVDEYLTGLMVGRYQPVVLFCDRDFRLLEMMSPGLSGSGNGELDWASHDFSDLALGQNVEDALPFLVGLRPEDIVEPEVIEFYEYGDGRASHMHLLPQANGFCVLAMDATAEYQRHRAMQQQANELDLLNRRQRAILKSLNEAHQVARQQLGDQRREAQARSRFIAGMSHEFRTPLSSVLGHTARAKRNHDSPDQLDYHLNAAERSANHLLALVGNVLDQAQLEAGTLIIDPVNASPLAMLEELEEMFAPLAADKGLVLNVESAPGVPEQLRLDATRVRQVLINLLGNAIKYSEQGRVDLKLSWQVSDPDAGQSAAAAGRLCFEVADSGPGIDAQAAEQIFQPFERLESGRRESGAGLGLSVSLGLAELMGARLHLVASSSSGSAFGFEVPCHMEAVVPLDDANDAVGAQKLLLVEDDEYVAALLLLYLKEAGYQVVQVSDGLAALRLIDEQPRFDVALVDLGLPDMEGAAVIAALTARSINTLAMSASNGRDEHEAADDAGAVGFLSKPIDPKHLLRMIVQVTDNAASSA